MTDDPKKFQNAITSTTTQTPNDTTTGGITFRYVYPYHPGGLAPVCPSCGHCPHCGRGGYGTHPAWPQPWQPPYYVWQSNT